MALRILTQVNYSAGNNPEGDSGLYFLSKLLLSLVRSDKELHFYVLVPKRHEQLWRSSLDHQRITCIPLNLEPRLHGGSFMFNPAELYSAFDFLQYDIDVLFLNQPETAPAFQNFLNRQMFNCLPTISYVHWFDTRPPGTPKRQMHKPALLGVLSGMIVSDLVGVNSEFGREQIVNYSKMWFNDDTVELLQTKLKILPPGIDGKDLSRVFKNRKRSKKHSKIKIIVNHRLLNYTGVRNLLTDIFPRLWEERKDFCVHATNPSKVRLPGSITQKPWLKVETLPTDDYMEVLGKSDIVISPHKATHWSISTLEAICAGCVPLLNKESFFQEMLQPILSQMNESTRKHISSRWFYHRSNLISKIISILDNIEEEREIARELARRTTKVYDWRVAQSAWSPAFRSIEEKIPIMPEMTPSMRKIFQLLINENSVSKFEILKELGWKPKQRTLAWTCFRKGLKRFADEDSNSPESHFKVRDEYREYLETLIYDPLIRKH